MAEQDADNIKPVSLDNGDSSIEEGIFRDTELVRLDVPFELLPSSKVKHSVSRIFDTESWERQVGLISNEGDIPCLE